MLKILKLQTDDPALSKVKRPNGQFGSKQKKIRGVCYNAFKRMASIKDLKKRCKPILLFNGSFLHKIKSSLIHLSVLSRTPLKVGES